MSSERPASLFIPELTGWRGVAALVVYFFHFKGFLRSAYPWLDQVGPLNPLVLLDGGFLGVHLFFVLSGFCLYLSYQPGKLGLFYWKRAIRVVPAYYFNLAVMIMLSLTRLVQEQIFSVWHIIAHLFFLQSVIPEYFSSINGVYWTLSTEVHFYAIFPLLMWLMRKFSPFAVWIWTLLGVLTFRHIFWYLHPDHMSLDFMTWTHYLPGRLDQFVVGMFIADLYLKWREQAASSTERAAKLRQVAQQMALAGLVFATYCAAFLALGPGNDNAFYVLREPLFAHLFAVLILASCFAPPVLRFLTWRWTMWFGEISYSFYLWHAPVAFVLIPRLAEFMKNPWYFVLFGVIYIPLSIFVSWLGYKISEEPVLRFKQRIR